MGKFSQKVGLKPFYEEEMRDEFFKCDGCGNVNYLDGSVDVGFIYCEDCQKTNYEARWNIFQAEYTNHNAAGIDLMEKVQAGEFYAEELKKEILELKDQAVRSCEYGFDEGFKRGQSSILSERSNCTEAIC